MIFRTRLIVLLIGFSFVLLACQLSGIFNAAYPGEEVDFEITDTISPIATIAKTQVGGYPYPELEESKSAGGQGYPVPAVSQPVALETAYPGPSDYQPYLPPENMSSPSVSQTDATQPGEYPGPGTIFPTLSTAWTATITIESGDSRPSGTPEVNFPPTLSITPTFTTTPTPTATNTPVPAPAWLGQPLQASDPHTVRLDSGQIQLVEFFAFWDGMSQAMAPLVSSIEEQYSSRMNFVFLDIDDPSTFEFQEQLGFDEQPHFFLLDEQGRIIQQWVGEVTISELITAIETALQ